MGEQNGAEVFMPPDTLKSRVGAALPKLDADAVARAEKALERLSGQFDDWMREELTKLEAAWSAARSGALDTEEGEALYRCAHDVKGLGSTYEYPLVTRLAASLCRLLETPERRATAPIGLVGGLIDGIRVAVRDDIRTDDNPIGRALAEESEAIVAQIAKD